MARARLSVEPLPTLHIRLLRDRYAFVHLLDFVFYGIGWQNCAQWDCEVYFDVPRGRLGFTVGGRPGDVDLLIVPCWGRQRLWEDAVAVEVKSYRLPRSARDKSPGDSGRAQVWGLADMGFPFVGLLHLVAIEAGGPSEWRDLPVWPTNTWMPRDAPPERYAPTDVSGTTFYFRQRGRMERLDLPECAGAKVFSLTLDHEGQIVGTSVGHERTPKRNPSVPPLLIARLPTALLGATGLRCGYSKPRFRVRPI